MRVPVRFADHPPTYFAVECFASTRVKHASGTPSPNSGYMVKACFLEFRAPSTVIESAASLSVEHIITPTQWP